MNAVTCRLLGEENMSAVTAFKVNTKLTDSDFDQLFREHYELVYRTAFSVTGSAEDAEDVLQAIFLSLVRREFPPDLKKNPKAYLYRAAFNRAVDIVRSRRRDVLTNQAERFASIAAPQDSMAAEDAERRLYEAIANLHPASAQILILRYVHGHSVAEIASLLGTTRSTVAVSLFRSRARLRKLIRALGENS
jgi:RNA polymerase sigma-70 factor (ECF subfamily)